MFVQHHTSNFAFYLFKKENEGSVQGHLVQNSMFCTRLAVWAKQDATGKFLRVVDFLFSSKIVDMYILDIDL